MSFYSRLIAGRNPRAYYRLSDQSPSTDMVDFGANHEDGLYSGTYTLDQNGALVRDNNPSVHFNNGAGTTPSSLLTGQLADGYTVEFWYWLDSLRNYNAGVTCTDSNQPAPWDCYTTDDGVFHFISATTDGNTTMTANLTAGAWHLIHLQNDMASNKARIFVDGSMIAEQAITGTIPDTSKPVILGNRGDGGTGLIGLLDEVAVYTGASGILTADQIQASWLAGTNPPTGVNASVSRNWYMNARMSG